MPDHQSSTDETSRLFGNRNPPGSTWRINLDIIKAFGIIMFTIGMAYGWFTTTSKIYCDTCPKQMEKTYIVQLFLFAHTCVYIDENPAKTIVAICFLIALLALNLYTYLVKERIKNEAASDPRLEYVAIISKYTWRIRFICFLVFPLCFVNSPVYDPHPFVDPLDATWEQLFADPAWGQFIRHYIPYLLWQLAVALQAIEQAFYHHNMGTMPFGISKTAIKIYSGGMSLLFVYYTLWIVTFLCGVPFIGHTVNEDPYVEHDWKENKNTQWGLFIMLLYDLLTVIIPLFLCLCRGFGIGCKKEAAWEITFSPSKKE
mmetsp:Transcript_62355/g.71602  ORF Transcript_62355/g.71602 Transcript_62355/m.71602 type:complete len:315 (+) Transcript_62355:155-1099(+)